MLPPVGLVNRTIALPSVDFPQPDSPTKPQSLAERDVQRSAIHRAHGSGLAQQDTAAHRKVDAEIVYR